MTMKSRNVFCSLFAVLFFFAVACVGTAHADSRITPQTINFLVKAVSQSNLTFIRNGEKHTCKEAAEHMMKKYDFFRSRVKTTDDFISLCATKSILSGKPYMVVTKQGTIPVAQWLEQELAEHARG